MKTRFKSLTSPFFLIPLALLLLNDFYLKIEYHNWLTGKLSDFCGLFIFPFFWSVLYPKRKLEIYFLSGFLFILWKSPFSEAFISFFSSQLYPIERVVDFSDLIALTILPMAYHAQKLKINFKKLSPIAISIITIFAFCATSRAKYSQQFVQPQYILLKSNELYSDQSNYNEFVIHNLDSIQSIIEVKNIVTENYPVLKDEYLKVKILNDLDIRVLKEFHNYKHQYEMDRSQVNFEKMRDSLTITGKHSFLLDQMDFKDSLYFTNTRLDGPYKRFDFNGNLLIEGFYSDGIEDSVWKYYRKGEVQMKKFHQNGELVLTQSKLDNNWINQKTNTRAQVITHKKFHIAILASLALVMCWLLFRNSKLPPLKISFGYKITYILLLPITILILIEFLTWLIPFTYSSFLGLITDGVFVFVVSIPVLLVIFLFVKPRRNLDILYYVILIAFSIMIFREVNMLHDIIAETTIPLPTIE